MKKLTNKYLNVALLSTYGLISTVVNAATPYDLADLVGARASSGEIALQERGYKFMRLDKGDDRNWAYWYRASINKCVTVAIYDGRYDAITDSPNDCHQSPKEKDNHTAEVAAAAVALGAIAAVAVHQHNKDKKHDQDNSVSNDIKDLVGARASSAERLFESKGYYSVKGSTAHYSKDVLWWNPTNRDCLGVITYDGRINNITKRSTSDCESSSSNSDSPSYSPASNITCYQNQRTCYRFGQGVDTYWTNREF